MPYCIAQALKNARQGKLEEGYTFAGSNAYRVNEIISVKELFQALEQEYAQAVYYNSIQPAVGVGIPG